VPRVTALRPSYDHHASAQMSDRDDPGLPVLLAIVHPVERGAGEHFGGIGEVETFGRIRR
jgi:hypothetical protein